MLEIMLEGGVEETLFFPFRSMLKEGGAGLGEI